MMYNSTNCAPGGVKSTNSLFRPLGPAFLFADVDTGNIRV